MPTGVYQRTKKYPDTTVVRFWAQVSKAGPDDCWEFNGVRRSGYGLIWVTAERDHIGAHRVSWEIHNGPIPKGLWVLHKCDNRPCVNPSHLFLGTAQDNTSDMIQKGRYVQPLRYSGQRNPNSKLSECDAANIKLEYAKGGLTYKDLGKFFGVSHTHIRGIIHGLSWHGKAEGETGWNSRAWREKRSAP